jgi:hypothetical protein
MDRRGGAGSGFEHAHPVAIPIDDHHHDDDDDGHSDGFAFAQWGRRREGQL